MKRLQKAAVLLSLADKLKEQGSWCGETHLQKIVFFLQELMDVPLGYDFILYKHGPYSFDLRDEITAMRADELLQMKVRLENYGPTFLGGENAARLKELFPVTIKKYDFCVDFLAEHLGKKTVKELECIATTFYVIKQREIQRADNDAMAERINNLKPYISRTEAKAAVILVDDITKKSKPEKVLCA